MAVRKRAVRAEKKKRRLVLSALFVLLAAAAAAIVFYVNRDPVWPPAEPVKNQSVTFASYDTSDVVSVTVRNSEGEYTVTQQDGVCRMEGRENFVFSQNMLSPLLENAAQIYADAKILDLSGSGYAFGDFGLGDDSIRVSVQYSDGNAIAFRIGSLIPQDTPQYYLRVEGDSAVYSVRIDVQETFMLSADALHAVTDPALNADLIDRVTFSGDNPFTIEYTGSEWYLAAPFRYPLNTAAVNTFLEKLESIRFAQFVAAEENADLAALSLAPARRTMTLSIAESILTGFDENGQAIASQKLPAYELTFLCGADKGDVLFYCLYRGEVVLATRFSASVLLTQSYDTLLSTTPFALSLSELTRLEWEGSGTSRAFDITLHERVLQNNDLETDESGNILYDVRVWENGSETDSDAFVLFYSRLVDAAVDTPLPAGYMLPDAHDLSVRLYRGDHVRDIRFYPYGELHYAVSVDGEAVFYISREKILSLQLPQ